MAQGGQRIGCLAGLGNEERGTVLRQGRLAVAELRRDIDFDGQLGIALEPVFGGRPCVIGRPTRDGQQAVSILQAQLPSREGEAFIDGADILGQGPCNGFRLFVDFLFHEVPATTLVDQVSSGRRQRDFPVGRTTSGVEDFRSARLDHAPVTLFEINDLAGKGRECHRIGADKGLAFAKANCQRAALAGGKYVIGQVGHDGRNGKRATQLPDGFAEGSLGGLLLVQF